MQKSARNYFLSYSAAAAIDRRPVSQSVSQAGSQFAGGRGGDKSSVRTSEIKKKKNENLKKDAEHESEVDVVRKVIIGGARS